MSGRTKPTSSPWRAAHRDAVGNAPASGQPPDQIQDGAHPLNCRASFQRSSLLPPSVFRSPKHQIQNKKANRSMHLTSIRHARKVPTAVMKKVAARFSSRYGHSDRSSGRFHRHGFLWSGALGGFRACRHREVHRSANPVLPDLLNSSGLSGSDQRTTHADLSARIMYSIPQLCQQPCAAPCIGGAHV